jgi:hypothetical protein
MKRLDLGWLSHRVLLGSLVALVVARPLVSANDPGRLSLLTGTGPLSINLCLFVLLLAFAIRRVATKSLAGSWDLIPLLLSLVGLGFLIASSGTDRYGRPGAFVVWEWVAIGVAFFLTRKLAADPKDARGLLNAILATAISAAAVGAYQGISEKLGLPSTELTKIEEPRLAGNLEFHPEMFAVPEGFGKPRGPFDRPEGLVALLCLCLPAMVVMLRSRGSQSWLARGRYLLPVVLLAGLVAGLSACGFGVGDFRLWLEHPTTGVGPGNLARHNASSTSSWSELLNTGGLIAAVPVVVAIVLLMRIRRSAETSPDSFSSTSPRWTFHIAGGAGLLLGLIWLVNDMPPESPPHDVQTIAGVAVARAVVWFVAFAILELVSVARVPLGIALLIGIDLAFAFGLVAGDVFSPAVQMLVWMSGAIAWNLLRPSTETSSGKFTLPLAIATIPLSLAILIGHYAFAVLPGSSTSLAIREARYFSRTFPEKHVLTEVHESGPRRARAYTDAKGFMAAYIVSPLRKAVERDPRNAALRLELARWLRPMWHYQLLLDPQDAVYIGRETLKAASFASELDPRNPAGNKSVFEALLLYRSESKTNPRERLTGLLKFIDRIAETEPLLEVPLRYRMVMVLIDQKDLDGVDEHVTILLRKNRLPGQPHGALTPEMKDKLIEKARANFEKLPKEIEAEWIQ